MPPLACQQLKIQIYWHASFFVQCNTTYTLVPIVYHLLRTLPPVGKKAAFSRPRARALQAAGGRPAAPLLASSWRVRHHPLEHYRLHPSAGRVEGVAPAPHSSAQTSALSHALPATGQAACPLRKAHTAPCWMSCGRASAAAGDSGQWHRLVPRSVAPWASASDTHNQPALRGRTGKKQHATDYGCVSIYIIRNARIENVCKSQSCMVSK